MGYPDEIIKVFTKYDDPFWSLFVPVLGEITAQPWGEMVDVVPGAVEYELVTLEQGLEGVRFGHYRRVISLSDIGGVNGN